MASPLVYCGRHQHLSQLLFLQRSQTPATKLFSLTPPDHRSRSSPWPTSGHGRTLQLRRSTRPFRSSRAHMQAWGWLQHPSHQINEHIRTALTDTGCGALLEHPDSHEAMASAQTASLSCPTSSEGLGYPSPGTRQRCCTHLRPELSASQRYQGRSCSKL